MVLPFWYRLTWVVQDEGPLNGKRVYSTVVCVADAGGAGAERAAGSDVQAAQHAVQSADERHRVSAGGAPREGDVPRRARRGQRRRAQLLHGVQSGRAVCRETAQPRAGARRQQEPTVQYVC